MSNTRTNRFEKNAAIRVQGLAVEVRNNDINKALRRFKKKVQDDGKLQELREREFYEKPSTTRKKAKAAARARHLKSLKKLADNR